jgi:hypothetical protein
MAQQNNQNMDPNYNPNTNQDYTYYDPNNPYATTPQPAQPNYAAPAPTDYPAQADYTQAAGYQDYTTQQAYDPNPSYNQPFNADYTQADPNAPVSPQPNTFEEKKSGNKLFLYGSIALVAVLLIATGVLIYINYFQGKNTATTEQPTKTEQTSTPTQPNPDTTTPTTPDTTTTQNNAAATGGASTPATKARKFSETKLQKTWVRQKFTSPDVDTEGNCLNLTKCGEQADPDKDGLSNVDEYNFQLDPLLPDNDKDGLADGDELFVYFSDPTNADSDSDKFKDGQEVGGCYDPIVNSTAKMDNSKQTQITSNISLKPLHEPSILTLKTAGATNTDLSNKGTVSAKCTPTPPATAGTQPTTSGTTTPAPTTSGTQTTTSSTQQPT